MRYLIVLSAVLILASCGTAPATHDDLSAASPTQTPAPDGQTAFAGSNLHFLITSALTDFHEHGPAGPLHFRQVRFGHIVKPDGEKQYMLCGQFQEVKKGSKAEWTSFATIRTTGYEQYIGGQGDEFCRPSSFMPDMEHEFSSSFQKMFDTDQPDLPILQ